MKTLFIFFLLTLTVSAYGQSIHGKVIDESKKETVSFVSIQLIDHFNKKIIDRTFSDVDGNFKFEKVASQLLDIKVLDIKYGDTTLQNIIVTRDTSLVINIHKLCVYDSSKNDKTCPLCHMKDQAIPIVYGLIEPEPGKEEEFRKKLDVKFHLGGCVISRCDPNWYCRRDKKEF